MNFFSRRASACPALIAVCITTLTVQADDVDNFIAAKMQERHITGVSLAIIDHGTIIKAKGYGFTDNTRQTPVTPDTLFQAGSVSKSVAAVGALHLVQEKRLSLNADVNSQLRGWRVPENEFTKDKKVTLREILSHSAGLTVHGFPGYPANAPIPALTNVLDGARPANTPAVRVDIPPGSKFRYSGGGYIVMQQMVIEASGKPFADCLRDAVLAPFGMTNSTFAQPLPANLTATAAAGYNLTGAEVRGRWHIYPELAAAGLWTTPSDLARFAIGIENAYAGNSNTVLSQAMTRQMLTVQFPALSKNDGLGVFLFGSGNSLQFSHGGRNAGFDSFFTASAGLGKGAVIMMNANNNDGAIKEIMQAIAKEYSWDDFDPSSVP